MRIDLLHVRADLKLDRINLNARDELLLSRAFLQDTTILDVSFAHSDSRRSRQLAFIVYEGINADAYRYLLTDTPVLLADVWQHVAATFDITTQSMQLYVDGVSLPSSLIPGSVVITSIADSVSPVRIGTAINSVGQAVEF